MDCAPPLKLTRNASRNIQHVLITGGSQGLGLALAVLLASCGAHVTICSRSEEKLKRALAQVEVSAQNQIVHSGAEHLCLEAHECARETAIVS